MEHKEYIRIVPGSKKAVLLIHGIAGSPAHFRDLVPVIPEDWSVYNILLDGHGKTVKDFANTSMKKWKAQVVTTLKELFSQYDHLVLVAHSMGTLFSIQAAIDFPDKIDGLFLLGVPTRPWVRASTVATSLRVSRGDISPDDAAALAMFGDTSIQLVKNPISYIGWAPRMVELLAECSRVRKALPQLAIPCRVYQSHTDELVSLRSARDLRNHPHIALTVLTDSGHFVYGPEDAQLLQQDLIKMLTEAAG